MYYLQYTRTSIKFYSFYIIIIRPRKKLLVSCNGLIKERVGGSVNLKKYIFLICCDLCMFYVDWELGGQKKLWGRDFFE